MGEYKVIAVDYVVEDRRLYSPGDEFVIGCKVRYDYLKEGGAVRDVEPEPSPVEEPSPPPPAEPSDEAVDEKAKGTKKKAADVLNSL